MKTNTYNKRRQAKGKFTKERSTSFKKDRTDSDISKEKYNDPSWYISRDQLARDVASLSFNNALGAPLDINFVQDGQTSAASLTLNVPGIYEILTVPTMGYATDGASPINIAAKNIYSWVRHQNSGHSNYDAPDIMLYLGAMDSVYALIAYMMRIYGTARVFSQTNRYVGDALLSAMGVNPNEIRANLANVRSFINMTITKASAFCTPNVMSLYKRHFWMFSGIYKDEDITKSQMYLYRPVALWQYEETDGAGMLQTVNFASNFNTTTGAITVAPITWAQLTNFVNVTLSKLMSSEDINIMSGDILKAYGRENLWTLGLVSEDYVTLPVYSEEVLSQIHNTTFVGRYPTHNVSPTDTSVTYTMDAFNVYQNPDVGEGAIMCTPQIVGSKHLGYAKILDMYKEDPTPEDVLVATRNMVFGTPMLIGSGDSRLVVTSLDSFGSDIALCAVVFTLRNGVVAVDTIEGNDANHSISTAILMSRFKQAPIIPVMSNNTWAGTLSNILGELGNYTLLDWNDVNKMHESSILAMLGVPFYGVAGK